MYHPPRGGVRGGRDQFNWEDVKTDKHRENYLGHSLHAPVGRWQQGKDLTWYAKDGKKDDSHEREIKAIKEAESDVMAELLGGGKRRVVTGNVTQQELTNVLKKQQEDEESDNIKETIQEVTKGFSSRRLSINEMVPDNTRIISEYKEISVTGLEDKNTLGNAQPSTIQLEDKKKSKKISKEKKKKKHKRDKHHDSKKKHNKRSKRDLSASPSQDDNNESIRGRNRYRKIDDHTVGRDHSGEHVEPRPHLKHDTGRYHSRSSTKRRSILRNRSRSTFTRRYRSRSNSPKRNSIPHRAIRYRFRSPRRNSLHRSPRRDAVHYRSRSPNVKYTRSRSRDDYYSSQHYRNKHESKEYNYDKRNDRG